MSLIDVNKALGQTQVDNTLRQSDYGDAIRRISSGKRLLDLKDFAADRAIWNHMSADTASLRVASHHAQKALGIINTAAGGVQNTIGILSRMNEIAVGVLDGAHGLKEIEIAENELAELTHAIEKAAIQTRYRRESLLSVTNISESPLQTVWQATLISDEDKPGEFAQLEGVTYRNRYATAEMMIGTYTLRYDEDIEQIELIDPIGNPVGPAKTIDPTKSNVVLFENGLVATFDPSVHEHEARYETRPIAYIPKIDEDLNTFNTIGTYGWDSYKPWFAELGILNTPSATLNIVGNTVNGEVKLDAVLPAPFLITSLVGFESGTYRISQEFTKHPDFLDIRQQTYSLQKLSVENGVESWETIDSAFKLYDTAASEYTMGTEEDEYVHFRKISLDIGDNEFENSFDPKLSRFIIKNPLESQTMQFQVGDEQHDVLNISLPEATTAALGLQESHPLRSGVGLNFIGEQRTLEEAKVNAQHAQAIIRDAIKALSKLQGSLGAQQTHLSHYVERISVTSVNMQATTNLLSASNLQEEVAKLSKFETMTQASMIGQSHASDLFTRVIQSLMR